MSTPTPSPNPHPFNTAPSLWRGLHVHAKRGERIAVTNGYVRFRGDTIGCFATQDDAKRTIIEAGWLADGSEQIALDRLTEFFVPKK